VSYSRGHYTVRWEVDNTLDLVFAAIHPNLTTVLGVDKTVAAVRAAFTKKFAADLKARSYAPSYDKFTSTYNAIASAEGHLTVASAPAIAPAVPVTAAAAATATAATAPVASALPAPPAVAASASVFTSAPTSASASVSGAPASPAAERTPLSEETRLQRIKELNDRLAQAAAAKKAGGAAGGKKGSQKDGGGASGAASPTGASGKKAPKKEATKWSDTPLTAAERTRLDFSEAAPASAEADAARRVHGDAPAVGERYWDPMAAAGVDDEDESAADEVAEAAAAEEEAKKGGGVWGYLQGLVGQKELSEDDLAGAAKHFTDALIKKNVAGEVAAKLVESVVKGLIGKKVGTFTTLHQTVRRGLEEALTRILTPKKPVDVMAGVAAARVARRPYSIVMCGVNGVGKSTSLAKIAAFFISQGLKVGVAACDTFRSGAIEQLRTHCAALRIPLYDKGYGKDEGSVAQESIAAAAKAGLDVILVDTAGRMQGNESLMKGLARLMTVNDPDLILFVGEALVGNDGCDQLVNFNRALAANSDRAYPRLIDGIVLTKFDTIDDKVGAAISMTYSTGQPIVFVGTGQTYRDLKRPNAAMLIKALLK
jgi:signal recognition particle receptor subunit alpha